MTHEFKDHFSSHPRAYSQFRPGYPTELFHYLAGLTPQHTLAWDCATGSGQSAIQLTPFYASVIATDASGQQLANATSHPKIQYQHATAEHSLLDEKSVDLITVAQALHWFDFEGFYSEVLRVMKPHGVIAAWCYKLLHVSPEIDELVNLLYQDIIGEFWPPERQYIEDSYQSIPFPFHELSAPAFQMTTQWSLSHLIHYLGTWSAVIKYQQLNHSDPVSTIIPELTKAWGKHTTRQVNWPLSMRVGSLARQNT